MDSKNFIINNLKELFTSHSYLEIRYEYRGNIATHIIEVKPIHCYDKDKEYILKQIALEEEFEQLYPNEEILFMTENVLIQIEIPILELGTSLIKQNAQEVISTDVLFELKSNQFDLIELIDVLSKVNINNPPYFVQCSQTDNQYTKYKESYGLYSPDTFYVHEPPSNYDCIQNEKNNTKKDSEIKQSLFFFINIAL